MLENLPRPTLHPTHNSLEGGIPNHSLPTRSPPRTATPPWKTHQRPNSTINLTPILPSRRSSSPSRSPTFLPFLNFSKDRSISPEPVSTEEAGEYEHGPTTEHPLETKVESRPMKLASWFNGSSEPLNITLIPSPMKEKRDPIFDSAEMERGLAGSFMSRESDNMTRRPQGRHQKSSSSLFVGFKDPAGINKLAFWRSRPVTNTEQSHLAEDELRGFDVQAALFPSGLTNDSSPEALHELQKTAEAAIYRFQVAYQKSLQLAREVTSERNVVIDELEAAQTRNEHLKLQLANMAAQSATQESATLSMAEELAAARCKISEDAAFRCRSLRIVTNESSNVDYDGSPGNTYRRRKRPSAESFASAESTSDSVFSQAPSGTCTPSSAVDINPPLFHAPRLGIEGMEPVKECQNCQGVTRSEAWDIVHMLKEESKALKARIAQCESANEDALSMLVIASASR